MAALDGAAEARTLLLSSMGVVVKARRLLELGRSYLPDVLETLEPLEAAFGSPEEHLLCEAIYERLPRASIWDVLERSHDVTVLPIPALMSGGRPRPGGEALASDG